MDKSISPSLKTASEQLGFKFILRFLLLPIILSVIAGVIFFGFPFLFSPSQLTEESALTTIFLYTLIIFSFVLVLFVPYFISVTVYWTLVKKFHYNAKSTSWLFPFFFAVISWFPSTMIPTIHSRFGDNLADVIVSLGIFALTLGLLWVAFIRLCLFIKSKLLP